MTPRAEQSVQNTSVQEQVALFKRLEEAGISIAAMAACLGLKERAISYKKCGKSRLSIDEAQQLLDLLRRKGVPRTSIFEMFCNGAPECLLPPLDPNKLAGHGKSKPSRPLSGPSLQELRRFSTPLKMADATDQRYYLNLIRPFLSDSGGIEYIWGLASRFFLEEFYDILGYPARSGLQAVSIYTLEAWLLHRHPVINYIPWEVLQSLYVGLASKTQPLLIPDRWGSSNRPDKMAESSPRRGLFLYLDWLAREYNTLIVPITASAKDARTSWLWKYETIALVSSSLLIKRVEPGRIEVTAISDEVRSEGDRFKNIEPIIWEQFNSWRGRGKEKEIYLDWTSLCLTNNSLFYPDGSYWG